MAWKSEKGSNPYYQQHKWPDFLRDAMKDSKDMAARRRLSFNETLDAADMIPQGKGQFYDYPTRVVWEVIFAKSIQIGRVDHVNVPRVEDLSKTEYWNAVSDFNQYLAVIRASRIVHDILSPECEAKFQALSELTWYQFITTPENPRDTPRRMIHEYWVNRVSSLIEREDYNSRLSYQYMHKRR